MTTTTSERVAARLLNEGYGPGAWHGPDLSAALADVTPDLAFRRPGAGRHNIAEIALHHAFCARNVRGQLSGVAPGPFVLAGEDWFVLNGPDRLTWDQVRAAVDAEHRQLAALAESIDSNETASPMTEPDRFGVLLGITCHAVYHAGQIQLIKRLLGAAG